MKDAAEEPKTSPDDGGTTEDAETSEPARQADRPRPGAEEDPRFASEETAEAARQAKVPWWDKRRQKIRDEIERNRRGEYVVPTWVLAVLLLVIIVGWASVIVFA